MGVSLISSPTFLVFFSCFTFCLLGEPVVGITRHYKFDVKLHNVTRLCHTKSIVSVNGQFPGPCIVAREGDQLLIKVINHVPNNISIHWHGIRQLRSGWADGPAYVAQCPIQTGQSYVYNFTITGQRGTLFWHAHISWLRATLYGPIIILPKLGVPYPFAKPYKEVPIIFDDSLRPMVGEHSCVWSPGNGNTILFWLDAWSGPEALNIKYSRLFSLAINKHARLADYSVNGSFDHDDWETFFRRSLREWELQDLSSLKSSCPENSLLNEKEDNLVWSLNQKDGFSVKRVTQELSSFESTGDDFQFKRIWKLKIPVKAQALLWLLFMNRVASKAFLHYRGLISDEQEAVCSRCKLFIEDSNHLFWSCQVSKEVWSRFGRWWQVDVQNLNNIDSFSEMILKHHLPTATQERWWTAIAAAIWTIWLTRNEATFESKQVTAEDIDFIIKTRALQWIKVFQSSKNPQLQATWWSDPNSHSIAAKSVIPSHLGMEERSSLVIEFLHQNSSSIIGIGGILFSQHQQVIAFLSGNIDAQDPNYPEIIAMIAVCEKVRNWSSCSGSAISFLSSSHALVSQISSSSTAPDLFDAKITKLRSLLYSCLKSEIIFLRHESAPSAINLALNGIHRISGIHCSWFSPQ